MTAVTGEASTEKIRPTVIVQIILPTLTVIIVS